ncbi:hypothetical protein JS528_05170 [Bifidobacterium sp. MA2]|uniref:ABC transporter permease n=1 Tax=Bifidobacterium santillanense TaxID=2809028 RepID=A0ABS5UPB1_9BIFI|nr:hypothetical protein [Bifidobacterium santillanense]MBT1172752.1 hypothetical protein [Bifidobacterium santillanense]
MTSPMRFDAILREAWRNVISGTSRICCCALAFALCAGGCALADYTQIDASIAQADRWVSSGASTYLISAPGGIDGQACERLGQVSGVRAAGAVRLLGRKLTFATLPSSGIPEYETTPHAAQALGMTGATARQDDAANGSVILSREAADALGTEAGSMQRLANGGTVRIAGIYAYPDDGRQNDFEYAVLSEVSSDSAFDTCLVRAWPVPDDIESLLYLTVRSAASSDDDRPQVRQLNTTLGSTPPDAAGYHARLTSWAPAAMLALGVLSGWALTYARRLELASALHAGYPKTGLLAQCLIESGIALAAGCTVTAPVLAYAVDGAGASDGMMMFATLTRIPLAGCCGVLLGTAIVVLTVRESRLFAYFRDR